MFVVSKKKKKKVEILSAFLVFHAVCQKKTLKVFGNQIRLYKYFSIYFTGLVKLNLKRDLRVVNHLSSNKIIIFDSNSTLIFLKKFLRLNFIEHRT